MEPANAARCGGARGSVWFQGVHDVLDEGAQFLPVDRDGLQFPGPDVVGLRVVQGAAADESPSGLASEVGADQTQTAGRTGAHTRLPSTNGEAEVSSCSSSSGEVTISGAGEVGCPYPHPAWT